MNAVVEAINVNNQLEPYQVAAGELSAQVERGEVTNAETAGQMTDLVKIAKSQYKRAEDARKTLVKPLNDHVKWINSQFKSTTNELNQIETTGKRKIGAWQREEEKRQRAVAEAARKQAEEEALATAERAERDGNTTAVDTALDSATSIPEPPRSAPTRGRFGGVASSRKVWKGEVTDLKALLRAIADDQAPASIAPVDQNSLNRLARNARGDSDIPGVRFYEDTSVQIR
jgi:hypothetical protein